MISIKGISLRRGQQQLLKDASLTIHSGQKVGVIGRNGTGKTSLFKLLMGELHADEGELDIPSDLRKAQMLQETASTTRNAIDYVIDGDFRFREVEKALKEAELADDHDLVANLHGEFDLLDGWNVQNRAKKLLSGLGFAVSDFQRQVIEFSGGWRIRLNLAQALMTPSDLLLLDEPTNHLDLEATLWLQQWLLRYKGSLLLISHDRSFIDVIVDHIVCFENKALFLTKGNYSSFERQKAERLAQQQAEYEKQQARRKEIENFVRRFRAKATKARQAQSRLKELNRMVDIAPAYVDSPFYFNFFEPEKCPASLVACEEIVFGYESPLVKNFSINIRGDSRIGLLGANGQGKSTLLKVLAGKLPLLGGEINRSDHLRLGYFAQHQVDELDGAATPIQLIRRLEEIASEQEIRNFLGGFDFRGDRVTETVAHFSGGEKTRLALALVVWQKPNLLLMDEPTNHLDLEMCHSLEMGLQGFGGALILVSHDRHLMGNVIDEFLLLKDGKLDYFEGNLDDYEKALLSGAEIESKKLEANPEKLNKRELRQLAADRRHELKPLRDRIKRLEREMEKLQIAMNEVEARLADTMLYSDEKKGELNSALFDQAKIAADLQQLEGEWLEKSSELEGLE